MYVKLIVFALASIATVESTTFDVTDYGAVPDGKTDSTAAINKAIAKMQEAGTGTLLFPAGKFLFGPVKVQNVHNSTMEFAEGAKLIGLPDKNAWPTEASSDSSGARPPYVPWIHAESCTNLQVNGGVFDGNGQYWVKAIPNAKEDNPRPFMMQFSDITNLKITGVHLTNSPHIHLKIGNSQQVEIAKFVANTTYDRENTEAIGLSGVDGAHIHDIWVHNGDDCVHTTGAGTKNILVEDSTFYGGHGLSVCGGGGLCTVENVVFRNCHLTDTSIGARVKLTDQTSGYIRNVTWSGLTMRHVKHPLQINVKYHSDPSRRSSSQKMEISDLYIKDIDSKDPLPMEHGLQLQDGGGGNMAEAGSFLCSKDVPCPKVHLSNVTMHTSKKWACGEVTLVEARKVLPDLSSCTGSSPPSPSPSPPSPSPPSPSPPSPSPPSPPAPPSPSGCDVDSCFHRCIAKYGGDVTTDSCQCAKGCAGMGKSGDRCIVKDFDNFCKYSGKERYNACKSHCNSISNPDKQTQCLYGCDFWDIAVYTV